MPAKCFQRVILLIAGIMQVFDIQIGVAHHECSACVDETLSEAPCGGDLEHAGRTPVAPNSVEIENEMNVAACETINRLPIVANAEQ